MELAIFGILLNLLGGVSTALGWALQKKVHNDIKGTEQIYLSKPLWWTGLVLVIMSQPLYLVAVYMTKLSILGVVGPFSIIANILLASYFLKERIRLWEYIGMILFIPGTILTLSFSSLENKRYNQREFSELFYSTQSMVYLLVTLIAMALLLGVSHAILKLNPDSPSTEYQEQVDDVTNAGSTVTCKGNDVEANRKASQNKSGFLAKVFSPGESLKMINGCQNNQTLLEYIFKNPRLRFLPLLVYPYFGPFLASVNLMFTRCIFGFMSATPDEGHSNFEGVGPFMYVSFIPIGGIGAYIIINKALQHYDTVYVVPLFKVGDLFHSFMTGGIFLREMGEYTPIEEIYFMMGGLICVIGILVLLLGNDRNEKEKMDANKGITESELKNF